MPSFQTKTLGGALMRALLVALSLLSASCCIDDAEAKTKAPRPTEIGGNGYFGQNDQTALGAASTSSTTFVDVGNGSSTGFAPWTAPTTRVSKTYMLHVHLLYYMSAIGASALTQFQVLQDGVAISSQPTSIARGAVLANGQYQQVH